MLQSIHQTRHGFTIFQPCSFSVLKFGKWTFIPRALSIKNHEHPPANAHSPSISFFHPTQTAEFIKNSNNNYNFSTRNLAVDNMRKTNNVDYSSDV